MSFGTTDASGAPLPAGTTILPATAKKAAVVTSNPLSYIPSGAVISTGPTNKVAANLDYDINPATAAQTAAIQKNYLADVAIAKSAVTKPLSPVIAKTTTTSLQSNLIGGGKTVDIGQSLTGLINAIPGGSLITGLASGLGIGGKKKHHRHGASYWRNRYEMAYWKGKYYDQMYGHHGGKK